MFHFKFINFYLFIDIQLSEIDNQSSTLWTNVRTCDFTPRLNQETSRCWSSLVEITVRMVGRMCPLWIRSDDLLGRGRSRPQLEMPRGAFLTRDVRSTKMPRRLSDESHGCRDDLLVQSRSGPHLEMPQRALSTTSVRFLLDVMQ